jgi:uncharacterized membrane protein
MESRARLFGHPVHQMLVVFPLGLLGGAAAFDLLYLVTGRDLFAVVAHLMMAGGLITGLLAAPFGTIDWLAIPRGTRAKSIGAMHAGGNVVVLLLFAGSWWLRRDNPAVPEVPAHVLSFAGVALSLVTAWLGGELVDRLGVGISDGAHLDAPSSLGAREAGAPSRAR